MKKALIFLALLFSSERSNLWSRKSKNDLEKKILEGSEIGTLDESVVEDLGFSLALNNCCDDNELTPLMIAAKSDHFFQAETR